MGLFSSKKKVYVSSTVYNLAGDDIKNRPEYLKTFTMKHVFGNSPSFSETITNGYLSGPGIKYRNYGKWARESGYNNYLGLSGTTVFTGSGINTNVIARNIPKPNNQGILIQTAEIDSPDYMYWAEQYVMSVYPYLADYNWQADFNESTDEITIRFSQSHSETFLASGFDPNKQYLFVRYQLQDVDPESTINTGKYIEITDSSSYPGLDGFSISGSEVNTQTTTHRKVSTVRVSYSDGTPDYVTRNNRDIEFPITTQTTKYTKSYEPTELVQGSGKFTQLIETIELVSTGSVVFEETTEQETKTFGELTVTTTTTLRRPVYKGITKYRVNTEVVTFLSDPPTKIFIYQQGTGRPQLDSLFGVVRSFGTYLPYIPIRYDNSFITGTRRTWANRASKKSLSEDISKIISKVGSSAGINDIDYSYIVFGVSLNTKDNTGKKYIYAFFDSIKDRLIAGGNTSWKVRYGTALKKWEEYVAQDSAYRNPFIRSYNRGVVVPPPLPSPPNLHVNVTGNLNYNMKIVIQNLEVLNGAGRFSNLKVGEVSIRYLGTEAFYRYTKSWNSNRYTRSIAFQMPVVEIVLQETATQWKGFKVYGLTHDNYIYRGKSVHITASVAMRSKEESGFLIPIHEDIFRSLSLKDATQLTTSGSYIVFNSYQVVKKKWYQSGFFKVFVFVAAIVISVYTGGAGAGLLGANAAVGASIGFTGMSAVIAGAIANALAAMIVTQLISTVSSTLLGDEFGALVGALASFYAIRIGTQMAAGTSTGFELNIVDLFKPENIMKFSMAVGEEFVNKIQQDTQSLALESQRLMDEYSEQSKKIASRYNDLFGSTNPLFSAIQLTDPFSFFGSGVESSDDFINRTLLVGSDIANISHNLINEFATITLDNRLPTL